MFRHGWTIAWVGWQWDVPRTPERIRIGLAAPEIPPEKRTPPVQAQLRFQPNQDMPELPLTDQHVGIIGNHQLNRTADIDDADAKLLVHDGLYGQPQEIARADWQFARWQGNTPVADDGHICLKGGFSAGRIYDLLYTPVACPIVGTGLLAVRDCAAYLRYDLSAPTAETIDHVIGEGQSQCGRFLRTLLYCGLHRDEADRPAFDGILAHIAGGRRGEFNHRYGQPSVQTTPSIGHLFPFADAPQCDPLTGRQEGLLDNLSGEPPKIFYTETSAEYWRGDAALAHTNLETGEDAVLPDNVRRYLFAGTQHLHGEAALTDMTPFGSHGANPLNFVDYRPLYRAALMNLLAWIAEGTEPPQNSFPSSRQQTRIDRRRAMAKLESISDFALPETDALNSLHPLDLGADAAQGVVRLPAIFAERRYPDWVADLDADGNERAGIAMPDISVPVATHTGFNPRHETTGGQGQILDYVGSSLPFPRDSAARDALKDPRPALNERYAGRDAYLAEIRRAAEKLAAQRYILAEDIPLCLSLAADRYDLCIAGPAD